MSYNEHQIVALNKDIVPIKANATGTIVHCYENGTYEVEFVKKDYDGNEEHNVLTVNEDDVFAVQTLYSTTFNLFHGIDEFGYTLTKEGNFDVAAIKEVEKQEAIELPTSMFDFIKLEVGTVFKLDDKCYAIVEHYFEHL
jgi:hypothetical protein